MTPTSAIAIRNVDLAIGASTANHERIPTIRIVDKFFRFRHAGKVALIHDRKVTFPSRGVAIVEILGH